jgi:hypothetical protein
VELPEPEGTALSCSDGGVAAARQPLSIATLLAFGMSAGQLAAAAASAPISGMTPSRPYMSEENGVAADGTPTQTFITLDMVVSGHDSTVMAATTVTTSIWKGTFRTTESAVFTGAIDVCPDAAGHANGSASLVADGSTSDGSSYHATASDTIALVVNDAARVESIDVTSMVSYRARGRNDADVAAHGSASFANGTFAPSNVSASDDRNDGSAESQRFVRENLHRFGLGIAAFVSSAAQSKWREGRGVPQVDVQARDRRDQRVDRGQVRHGHDVSRAAAPE